MLTLLKAKVKTRIMAKKTKEFAKELIGISFIQFLLIALILLPFAYLNLKGLYELLYVIFGLILFLIFLKKHEDYISLAFILFIIAGIYYVYVALPSPFGSLNPPPITNPLTNFFIFFSFDFMLATIIYIIFFYRPIESYEEIDEIKAIKLKYEKYKLQELLNEIKQRIKSEDDE